MTQKKEIHLRIDPERYADLQRAAAGDGRSVNSFIMMIVNNWLMLRAARKIYPEKPSVAEQIGTNPDRIHKDEERALPRRRRPRPASPKDQERSK